jgi:hypothetical protein
MTTKDKLLRAALDKVNDYKQTVNAILAFAAFVVHDGKSKRPNSQFGFGRRMTTSPDNSISPNSDITPDLTAQNSNKYGIVAEAKKALDQTQDNWKSHVERLRKYDDELAGWWTDDKKIPKSNSVMLIHQSRGRAFSGYLESCRNKASDSVGLNTCVVEFNESRETEPYYFFRLEFGDISDKELNSTLHEGIPVPLDRVRMSFSNIQYYDAKPPMPLLLERLWTDVFPSKMDGVEYDDKTKSFPIKVAVSDVTNELQKAYGSQALSQDNRSGEFPTQKWIREAFDQLVSYKIASPGTEEGEYIIYFKYFKSRRDDVLNRFILYELEKDEKKKDEKPSPKQMPLFKKK